MVSELEKAKSLIACNLCNNSTYSGKVNFKEQSGSRIIEGDICSKCSSIIYFQKESNYEKYEERSSNDFSAKKGPLLMKLRGLYRERLGKILAKKLNGFVKEKMIIVDYGAGSGDFSHAIFKAFPDSKVIAVDIAKNRPSGLPETIEYYSLKDFHNSGVNADLFVLNHVLEHIDNPTETLENINKKLDKNGKIYIEVPHTGSVWRKILGKYWAGYYWPFHLFIPSLKGLEYLTNNSNLQIEKSFPVEIPIFGSSLMHTSLPYQMAVVTGILFYPLQFVTSKLCGRSEAIGIVVSKVK